jgi:N-hydroxyarylamine O-acetyltransferase
MLPDELVDRVVDRLGVAQLDNDENGLFAAYAAWCGGVAFDNLHKRVWFAERQGPMPGDDPTTFFEMWLTHNAGGTCWGSSGALHALLLALGFDARRASGTMMLGDDPPPAQQRFNHGTVIAHFGDARWLLDTNMLTVEPLRLPSGAETTSVGGVAWARAEVSPALGGIRIHFDPANGRPPMSCLLERGDVDATFCSDRHARSEQASPFNTQTYVRRHIGDRLVVVATGEWHERAPRCSHVELLSDRSARGQRLLELGYSSEIVSRLPDDEP